MFYTGWPGREIAMVRAHSRFTDRGKNVPTYVRNLIGNGGKAPFKFFG